DCQKQALCRRIHRGVTRKPVHVKSFEADPHRMWRIGKATVGKRVSHQQVTEFVVNPRRRNGKPRKKCSTDPDYREKKQNSCTDLAASDGLEECARVAGNAVSRFAKNNLKGQQNSTGDQ